SPVVRSPTVHAAVREQRARVLPEGGEANGLTARVEHEGALRFARLAAGDPIAPTRRVAVARERARVPAARHELDDVFDGLGALRLAQRGNRAAADEPRNRAVPLRKSGLRRAELPRVVLAPALDAAVLEDRARHVVARGDRLDVGEAG